MAGAAQVKTLLDQLKVKQKEVQAKVQDDQFKKAELERKLVAATDELEDINGLLSKQKKLLRQYNNQLDEAKMSIKNLSRQAGKFEAAFGKIGKSDQAPAM